MKLNLNRGHYTAIGAVAIILIWMLSGDQSIESKKSPPVKITGNDLFSVQVQTVKNTEMTPFLKLHGQTAPSRQVNLSSEISGKVISLVKKEGDFVNTGDIILRIDPEDKKLRLVQAKALVNQRELEFKANTSLLNKGLLNETQLAESKTLLASAKAESKTLEVSLAATTIKAPFSGILENREVELGRYVRAGDPLISILNYNPFLIVAYSAEKDLPFIPLGKQALGQTINKQQFPGTIRYISSKASNASRTFKVELEIKNESGIMADGLTADIVIPLNTTRALFITPSILSLDKEGDLAVKGVNPSNNEIFVNKVRIVKAESQGVWVNGLKDNSLLVVAGQNFVSSGQKVIPVFKPTNKHLSEPSSELATDAEPTQ